MPYGENGARSNIFSWVNGFVIIPIATSVIGFDVFLILRHGDDECEIVPDVNDEASCE